MQSSFFDAKNYDRCYNSADFVRYFAALVGNGVFVEPANSMQAYSKGGMEIGVREGKCWINGRIGYADGSDSTTLAYGEEGMYRYDAIVVRLDLNTAVRDIHIDVIRGDDADSFDAAAKPAPIRDTMQYDIVLAYVAIGEGVSEITDAVITDTRFDAAVCGVVAGLVDNIDTKGLFNQYEAQWELLKAGCAQDADAVIAAWSALNTVKAINDIPPVNGNIALTQSLIPSDGVAYQMPYFVQSGTVTVGKDANTVEITFPRAFKAVPTIVLGTTSIPTDTRYPIIATHNQASAGGFTLIVRIINSGGIAALNQSSTVDWAAFGELAEV